MRHQGKEDTQKREATREKPRSRAINPGAASQIGEAVAKNPINWNNGATLNTHTKLGNELAGGVTRGPGGSRTVAKAGTQGAARRLIWAKT
jgi:hypothetical protein